MKRWFAILAFAALFSSMPLMACAQGQVPKGGPPGGPQGGRGGSFGASRAPEAAKTPPTAKDDAERKALKAMEDILQKQGRMLNVPVQDGRLLRVLAENSGAKTAVEFGTSNGISAIWLGLALRKTGGRLITHEIDKERAELAQANFAAAGVADLITVVEGDAHETMSNLQGPIDLLFINAEKGGYADYLKKILPLVRPGGLVLAHNMDARMANPEYIKAITTNPELETVFYMEGAEMSVTLKKR